MTEYTTDQIHELAYDFIKHSELWRLLPTNADIGNAADRLAIQFESLVDTFIRAETEKLGVEV